MMFHVSNRIKGRAIERIGAGMGEMRELEKELNWKKRRKGRGPMQKDGVPLSVCSGRECAQKPNRLCLKTTSDCDSIIRLFCK